jgi:Ca-activated chloride channel homolog
MKYIISIIVAAVITTAISITNPSRTVSGTISDEIGQPLISANVVVKGTSKSATTDYYGKYAIEIPDYGGILVISHAGFATKEVVIGVSNIVNISMTSIEYKVEEELIIHETMPIGVIYQSLTPSAASMSTNGYRNVRPGSALTPFAGYNDPVNWNTEDYALINENKFHDPKTSPLSTFSIDTDGASYSNLRRFLTNGQTPPIDAIRIEEMVNYFSYEYKSPQGDVPFSINTEVGVCPWSKKHKLVHIGLKGLEIPTENLPASNLVFLLDVSGSMQAYNKLPLVIQSFKLLTGQLREQDRVAIVVYAGSSGVVLPSTTGADKNTIIEALSRLRAGGSTAGARGIQLAYEVARQNFVEGGNNRVILATDGDFNVGQSSDAELVRIIEKERESGVFLSVLGFGMGNYKDNKMQELADHGNGNHNYIDNISEAKKVFINEFGGTLFTIAKDVKIQVEFNPAEVAGYRLIGYENRMLEAEDFNDDKEDAGEIGSGHTVTALYEIIPVGVKSEFLTSVDPLKYQKTGKAKSGDNSSGELMHVKIRYKSPQGSKSLLVEQSIEPNAKSLTSTTDNFRWSAAVASFGMQLRNSPFKGDASMKLVESMAVGARGSDPFGYRSEFIQLVRGVMPMMELEASR